MLKLISDINSHHETHVTAKQSAEQFKREALMAHQKRLDEAREARKGRKEQRLGELKDQVREQKQKLAQKEKGGDDEFSGGKKGNRKGGNRKDGNRKGGKNDNGGGSSEFKGKPNKKGKRVTFAS